MFKDLLNVNIREERTAIKTFPAVKLLINSINIFVQKTKHETKQTNFSRDLNSQEVHRTSNTTSPPMTIFKIDSNDLVSLKCFE